MSISHHSQIKLLFSSFLEYEFSFGFFFSKTRWSSHTLVSIFLHLLWFLYQKQMDLWLFWKKKYIPISWESIYFITHPCKQAGKKRRFFKVGGPMNKILVLRNKRFSSGWSCFGGTTQKLFLQIGQAFDWLNFKMANDMSVYSFDSVHQKLKSKRREQGTENDI